MSAWNAAGVQIHFEYYYWYWIDLVTTTKLLSIQYPYRFGITTWKPITRHNSWNRNQICFITDESFHDFVHSVVCPLHDEVILLYYSMTTRGSALNEGGYCGASFTGTQRRRIEYNITVRAEQRRMPVLALEIWRYTDSILWCSKPSWNITLYVRDHIIRTRRHLDR